MPIPSPTMSKFTIRLSFAAALLVFIAILANHDLRRATPGHLHPVASRAGSAAGESSAAAEAVFVGGDSEEPSGHPGPHSTSRLRRDERTGVSVPADPEDLPSGLLPVGLKSEPREPSPAARPSVRVAAGGGRTIAGILRGADMSDPATRARVEAEIRRLERDQKAAVEARAAELGIPLHKEGPGKGFSTLHDIRGDQPLYRTARNLNAAISTGANLLVPSPYSLTGSGVKVGVWDGGSVRSTHRELTGRVTLQDATAALDDHATHVAGTIGASGVDASAKGMAPQVSIDSYDWNEDYAEMTAAGAATAGDTTRIPLSNHSYGFDATTADMGVYETEASSVDAVAASLPYYLPFWAAGNEQDLLTARNGFQSITFSGLAKNIMTIGAVDDAVAAGVRAPAAGVIAYFSSLGPCDDGRIKPDLVANGIGVYSSIATGNAAYDGTYDGTSMATPGAMGSAALIQQLYGREFSGQRMRASTLKSLLIHTADDLGNPGPDYTYGWGLIHVKAAADTLLAHKASLAAPKIIENTLTSSVTSRNHTFTWDGVSPIRATLCWTDPAGAVQTGTDSRVPNLVHNLDAKITAPDGTTVVMPFVMPFVGTWSTASMSALAVRGKNNVDNVEQVLISAPTQAGDYTVTVSLDGNLTNAAQPYSLVVTGGTSVETNPPPSVSLTSPAEGTIVLAGSPVALGATATDLAIGSAPGSVAQVEFFEGANSLGVDADAPYALSWTPAAAGVYQITARATDGEGATSTSAARSVTVLAGSGVPVVTSFTPGSGQTGAAVVVSGSNFAGVTAVRINGVDTAFTVVSLTEITFTVPALATTGPITVVNSFGTGSSSSVFTVVESPVLISQVYGAGGNTGAAYRQDYVELYNRSSSAVNLTGWSVQYASSTGVTWAAASLSGSIAPGAYYLVGLGSGTSGAVIPAPDATANIAMAATSGKVALRSSTTPISGASPAGASGLQDFVGYGTANASEGSPAPSPSTTTAIFRAGGGATDTGNNSADFAAASPNPRNTSTGPPVAPVITSATTATGTVGLAFTYQITAANVPTSFGAATLPSGLTVNPSTGLISGVPTAAGTTSVTISATNTAGTGTAALQITINPTSATPVTLFSENMGTPTATTPIVTHAFQNSGYTFTGTGDVRNTQPSIGYAGASGSGNVFLATGSTIFYQISGINTSGHSGLSLSVGHYKATTASSNELVIETSTDGTTYTPLTYTRPTGSGTTTWLKVTPTGTIPSTPNLRIRFRQTSTSAQFRVDDVVLTGIPVTVTPVVSTTGALAAVPSVYGSPSASPSSFSVSGSNLTAGIVVTAPAGFEVSQDPAGTSGYAPSLTVAGTGSIASTPIHVRLAAGVSAGGYSGDVVCTSVGALAVSVPTVPSNVAPKIATITADNRSKTFGSILTLGTGQTAFAASGLVGSETIGTVTLTASGGLAANDPPGTYTITPSAPTGGSFDPANYDFDFVAGTLTVTPPAYADWIASFSGLSDPSEKGDPDGDGFVNLMEYFAGLNPSLVDGPVVTASSAQGGVLSMTYRRAKGTTGVAGVVKWSDDLLQGTWSAAGVSETIQDLGSYELRTASIPMAGPGGRRFLTLEVAAP